MLSGATDPLHYTVLEAPLSDPFGVEANDLPLDALVRGIERDLQHAMGVEALLPPLAAKGQLLLCHRQSRLSPLSCTAGEGGTHEVGG